jgi:hypothetical protein
MALLAPIAVSKTGTVVAYQAATSGPGDTFVPNSRGVLLIKNGSGAPITATVVIPGNTDWSQPQPDVAVVIAAGAEAAIGPFPQNAADPITGLITVTYTAVATVTVAYLSA